MTRLDPVLDGREGPARALISAKDVIPLTKGAPGFEDTRALLVGVAGTANVVTAAGKTRSNVPLVAGWNPLRISRLLAGGTADDIWGVY